jgi:hypothetical protein
MSLFSDIPNRQPDHAAQATCRLVELIETYLSKVSRACGQDAGEYCITLIARSPASPAAAALATKAQDLGAWQVSARIILAKPAPSEALEDLIQAVKPVLRGEEVCSRLRWARNPGLLDAHEQMTLGSSICWSGDAMRRSPQRRSALEIAEEDAPSSVHLARLSFSALWSCSRPLGRRQASSEKRRLFESLSEMAMAVHRREGGGVAIPSMNEDTTRH